MERPKPNLALPDLGFSSSKAKIGSVQTTENQHNHSACAGKQGLGAMLPNKQSAKSTTIALLTITVLR